MNTSSRISRTLSHTLVELGTVELHGPAPLALSLLPDLFPFHGPLRHRLVRLLRRQLSAKLGYAIVAVILVSLGRHVGFRRPTVEAAPRHL